MQIKELLQKAIENKASDIFFVAGMPVTYIIDSQHMKDGEMLKPDKIREIIENIYEMAGRPIEHLEEKLDDDFSLSIPMVGRFRINVFFQRGSLATVIKVIRFGLPKAEEIGVGEDILSLTSSRRGLILVTGEAGSGRSTTLACMIDEINRNKTGHIVTLENPIEFTHRHNNCIVSQREVYIDTMGYKEGLKAALREKPDVIFLSEARDEVIPDILTASETGVLLLSSMYTPNSVTTIRRFLDAFPAEYRPQAQSRLSQSLTGIVCQRLVPTLNNGIVPVFEIMRSNPVIKDMIRKDNLSKLELVMQSSEGMTTIDESLMKLYSQRMVTKETVLNNCTHYDVMSRRLNM